MWQFMDLCMLKLYFYNLLEEAFVDPDGYEVVISFEVVCIFCVQQAIELEG